MKKEPPHADICWIPDFQEKYAVSFREAKALLDAHKSPRWVYVRFPRWAMFGEPGNAIKHIKVVEETLRAFESLRVNSPKLASFLAVLDTPQLAAGRFNARSGMIIYICKSAGAVPAGVAYEFPQESIKK